MVRIEIKTGEVLGMLGRMADRSADLSRPMAQIANRLRADILLNFRTGGTYPEEWAPSQRVLTEGGQTLVDRAILRNSMHPAHGPDFAAAGTDLVYAAIHQFGGRAGRGHSVTIPARPFLPVRDGELRPETTRFAAEALLHHVLASGGSRA